MKKIISGGIFLLLILSFVSCNFDEDDPILYGDAYIFSEDSISNTGEKAVYYNLILISSCSNYEISSVTANNGANSYTLTSDGTYFSTKEGPFTSYDNLIGKYTFNFSFISANADTLSNEVTSEILQPVTINSCTGIDDGENLSIFLKWNKPENADAIYIQLRNSTNTVIFTSRTGYYDYYTLLNNTEYTISSDTGTWADDTTLSKDEKYTVEISISNYESSSSIQAESIAKATVNWE